MAQAALIITIAVELGVVFEAIGEVFFRLFHEDFLFSVAGALGFGAAEGDFFADKGAIDVQKALSEEIASVARDGHLEPAGRRDRKPHAFRERVFADNYFTKLGIIDNHAASNSLFCWYRG